MKVQPIDVPEPAVSGDDVDEVGAVESVEEAYRRLGRELLQLATLLTGSRLAAEEIVHDVFTAAIPRWRGIAQPERYLRRAVVNRCRSHGRRVTTARRWRGEPEVTPGEPELDETWQLLRALPAKQRAAIVLRIHLDLSYRDVAALVGCPEATARSLVFRGLELLRRELS